MRRIERAALLLLVEIGATAFAQTVSTLETPKDKVRMVNLSAPVYPPLARLANVMGHVEVKLEIRKDGSVASANVENVRSSTALGNKMLPPAALDSARKSLFECHQCADDLTPYTLVYSFEVSAKYDSDWPCPADYKPKIVQAENHVSLTVEPRMVQATFSDTKTRSAKCLYLWRCGYEWGGMEFYYYRAHSMKCLDMWNCGYKLREPYARCYRLHREILY
jgi:TonB family protein